MDNMVHRWRISNFKNTICIITRLYFDEVPSLFGFLTDGQPLDLIILPVLGLTVLSGITLFSLDALSSSSLALYASMAVKITLFFKSSKTILSYVSKLVCHV